MLSLNFKNQFEKELKTNIDKKIFYTCLNKYCSKKQIKEIMTEFLVIKGKKVFPKKKVKNNEIKKLTIEI
tara:strand:- start:5692 stop:5901 length:210 start_codon:yes stop_codon:yes gene_type:complete